MQPISGQKQSSADCFLAEHVQPVQYNSIHFSVSKGDDVMKKLSTLLCAVALSVGMTGAAQAATGSSPTVSPYQSLLRPLLLPIAGLVYEGGTDTTSASVQSLVPTYVNYIKQMLPEGVAFTGEGLYVLDPTRLYFPFAYAPRVYYIYEGACYNNALGVTIGSAAPPTSSAPSGTSYTVFPLGHSSVTPVCGPSSGVGTRSTTYPLLAGDFVQLPTVNSGQQLAFFIMANMDSTGNPANEFYNGTSTKRRQLPALGGVLPG